MLPSQQLVVALLEFIHANLSIRCPGRAQELPETLQDIVQLAAYSP